MTYHFNGLYSMVGACPKCNTSCHSLEMIITLVRYGSPDEHNHDDNCRRYTFQCDCGCKFMINPVNLCPTIGCGWSGKDKCFCGKGTHVL